MNFCGTRRCPETTRYLLFMTVNGAAGQRYCCRRCTLAALNFGENWANGHAIATGIQTARYLI